MKRLLILLCITIAFSNNGNEDKQKTKKLSEQISADENTTFIVNVTNGSDVLITKSKDNQIYLKFTIEVTENDKQDYLMNFPEDFKLLKKTGDRIVIDTESIYLLLAEEYRPGFFEKLFSSLARGKEGSINNINGVMKYTKDGKSYIIPSHIMTVELQVPKIKEFMHKNKYGTSVIEDMDADYNELNLYQTKLTIKNMNGDLDVVDKYSEAIIDNVAGDMDAEFYELDGRVSNIYGNLKMTNKYSKMSITDVKGSADITGYELDLTLNNVGKDLKLINKYQTSSVKTIGGNVTMELYESSLKLSDIIGNVDINSKYDPVDIQNIGGSLHVVLYESNFDAFKIGKGITGEMKYGYAHIDDVGANVDLTGYEVKYKIKNVHDISLNAKYGNIDISGVFNDIEIDSYEGDLTISKAKSDPINVDISKKYGKIEFNGFDYDKYRIKAKAKHATIHISNLNDELNDDRTELKYQWSKKELKTINIDGYSTDISFD